jgi:glycosyltransferase involved in cell wall biosynthesis
MSVLTDAGKAVRVLRREGFDGIAQRLSRRAAQRWGGNLEPLYLRPEDIVDSSTLRQPPAGEPKEVGTPLNIGWIITVPGPASGGHTTIFRFVEALEAAGHRCVLYVYDGQHGDAAQYEGIIRQWWPRVRAEVRAVRDGIQGMDAYVATAWATAHALAKHSDIPGRRFYLVQDYEPWFYPRGTAYELAEDTYRFGFSTITIGHMLAAELSERYGYESTVAEFGCDTEKYGIDNRGERTGVVFYAKPGVARRGYELGVMALERLSRLRPDVVIHTFGIKARALPFPAVVHGHMTTSDLNVLYNQCGAGLALSFSNISLIPYELLAAGVVPVMNDYEGLRSNLDNPNVVWARSTPDALAEALATALDRQQEIGPDPLRASVEGLSWNPAQDTVVRAIEQGCAQLSAAASREAGAS